MLGGNPAALERLLMLRLMNHRLNNWHEESICVMLSTTQLIMCNIKYIGPCFFPLQSYELLLCIWCEENVFIFSVWRTTDKYSHVLPAVAVMTVRVTLEWRQSAMGLSITGEVPTT